MVPVGTILACNNMATLIIQSLQYRTIASWEAIQWSQYWALCPLIGFLFGLHIIIFVICLIMHHISLWAK